MSIGDLKSIFDIIIEWGRLRSNVNVGHSKNIIKYPHRFEPGFGGEIEWQSDDISN